ncbi:MAG: 30S ribosomal protein S13 [Candidatus Aenigmarchaeota archaeon]|nr:30S ribosomal protein S13 [Candidatus Aenigmarchaeota archaeon]
MERKAGKTGNIIRLVETNLEGDKPVKAAIRRIPGVGFMFSNAISKISGLGDKKLSSLSQEELDKLAEIIQNPQKFSLPIWMLNRRKDLIQGTDKHVSASALDFAKRTDLNMMKKLRLYKGIRHAAGLPVRGQRTRGSFRKGKTVGVSRSKQQPAKAKKK